MSINHSRKRMGTGFSSFYKKFALSGLLILFISGCEQQTVELIEQVPEKPVKYISYLKTDQEADGVLVKFLSNTGGKTRSRSLRSAGLTADATGQFKLVPGLTLAKVDGGLTVNQTLSSLASDPNIAYAEPNYIFTLDAIPNDAAFNMQYGLNNANGADIDAPQAWDVTTGNTNVVIAVIDSGVDYSHPDLQGQIWTNPGETPNNNRDDDGNGYVDDIHGYDFDANDNDPMDEHNHGTHVSGIIGANTNNAEGVAGINWSVQIMALKFMSAQGRGSTANAIRAIDYAVANGASISNNSWGGGPFSQALYDTIQSANRANHLFVAAAGNGDTAGNGINNDSNPHYPSSYNLPNIISVAATDRSDSIGRFSNFGARSVDLGAPGVSIHSTIRNGAYQSFSGTSMAAPFVAGVAGLVLSQNPNLSVTELKSAIMNNVDVISSMTGVTVSNGRLNALNAVTSVTSAPPPATVAPVQINQPNSASLTVGDTLQLTATGGNGSYIWTSSSPAAISVNQNTGMINALATGNASITATDGNGLVSPTISLSASVAVANLNISPSNVSQIPLAGTQQFNVIGGTAPYTWTSSDTTVASVSYGILSSQAARVTANSDGNFNLTVTDANGTTLNSPIVTVVIPPLSLSSSKSTLNIQETIQLSVSGGTSPYSWNSSNTNILTVNTGGMVTAINPGTASITVQDIAGTSRSVNMTVLNPPTIGGGSMNLTPTDSVAGVGSRSRLVATGGGVSVSWSSSDPTIASVDTRGIVTANAVGIVQISATDGQGNSGTASFEVRALEIVASVLTIGAGDKLQLNVNGGAAPYTWKVSNNSLASIDAGGLLSSSAGQTGGILVTATDAAGISKSIIVTINNATSFREPRTL